MLLWWTRIYFNIRGNFYTAWCRKLKEENEQLWKENEQLRKNNVVKDATIKEPREIKVLKKIKIRRIIILTGLTEISLKKF